MEVQRFNGSPRYSEAVICGSMLYLSGLTSEETGVAAQARDTLAQLEQLLEKYGSDKEHLVHATIYLRDIRSYDEFNAVWDPWVAKGHAPTRACVEARLAEPGIDLEVVAVAALK